MEKEDCVFYNVLPDRAGQMFFHYIGWWKSYVLKNQKKYKGALSLRLEIQPSTDGETSYYFPALTRQSGTKKWNIVIVRSSRCRKRPGVDHSQKRQNSTKV